MIPLRPGRFRRLASTLAFAFTPASALTFVLGFSLLVNLGCGESGPQMGRVSGTVTYNGKPVTKGSVSFVSTEPERPNANGPIGTDGSYTLQTLEPGDGAQVGDYQVVISGKDPEELNNPLPGVVVKVKSEIPTKFENPGTSGLKETVKAGSNTLNFDLKD